MFLAGNIVHHHTSLTMHILPSLVVKCQRTNELISPKFVRTALLPCSVPGLRSGHIHHPDKCDVHSFVLTATQLNTFHGLTLNFSNGGQYNYFNKEGNWLQGQLKARLCNEDPERRLAGSCTYCGVQSGLQDGHKQAAGVCAGCQTPAC